MISEHSAPSAGLLAKDFALVDHGFRFVTWFVFMSISVVEPNEHLGTVS